MMVINRVPRLRPLYNTLGDLKLILDATGLRDNTNNEYGQVTNGVAQLWKSIPPAPDLGVYMFGADAIGNPGEASILKFLDGYIEFPGYVCLSYDASQANYFNFKSYAVPYTAIKYTIHQVLRVGSEEFPNSNYGFYGNNASTQGAKGNCTFFDDRVGNSGIPSARNNTIAGYITKGTIPFIISAESNNIITPGVPFVYTEETDLSLADPNKRKQYINGISVSPNAILSSTAVVSGPTYTLQIGAAGNKVAPFRGWISHLIIQNRIESGAVRDAFIQSLLPFKNKASSNYYYTIDESIPFNIYDVLATSGKFYYTLGFCSPPNNKNKVIQFFTEGNTAASVDKFVAMRVSNDRGRTFAAQTTVMNIGGGWGSQIGAFGYDSAGRLHGISDAHTAIGSPGSHALWYHYSDDDGASWTNIDITSSFPADGLVTFRMGINLFEHAGFVWASLAKFTNEADYTSVASYLLRKPIGSSTTWSMFPIITPALAPPLLLYPSIAPLGDDSILAIIYNNTSMEWTQVRVINITTTPTAIVDGDITFGESRTIPTMVTLSWFQMNGQRVIAAWLHNRDTAGVRNGQVVYGIASNIEANEIFGWDNTTKYTFYTGTQIIQWGRVLHYNNDFNAIASWMREPEPPLNNDNNVICFSCPGNQYYETRRKLFGITTGP